MFYNFGQKDKENSPRTLSSPEQGYKTFFVSSTQLSMKFQLLKKI